MKRRTIYKSLASISLTIVLWGCITPPTSMKTEDKSVPVSFAQTQDTTNVAKLNWRKYFSDDNLIALIDTALRNNQELNITMQEIEISKNEIRARKGEYLPFVGLGAGAGIDKSAEYTRNGAVEKNLEVKPGT